MKKLLAIMASACFVSTSSCPLVSCAKKNEEINLNKDISISHATIGEDGKLLYIVLDDVLKSKINLKTISFVDKQNDDIKITKILVNKVGSKSLELELSRSVLPKDECFIKISCFKNVDDLSVENRSAFSNLDIKIKSAKISEDGLTLDVLLSDYLVNDLQDVNSMTDGSFDFSDKNNDQIDMLKSAGAKAGSNSITISLDSVVKKNDECEIKIMGIDGAEFGYCSPFVCDNQSQVI